jgi:chemotaxis protein MotB
MADQHPETPIRIVKKKSGGHGHHGGAWKVAYADFVTAMMALFIVLWIVGQSKQVKQYIANYFKDPGAFFENSKGGGVLEGGGIISHDQEIDPELKREKQKLEEMGKQIMAGLAQDPTLSNLKNQITVEVIDEGLRIELLEGASTVFFDVGTSVLKSEATKVLGIIATQIGKLPNRVVVEGHTDARPYNRKDGYTNFELSAERANSARRVLATRGLRVGQIDEIRGYADTRLRNTKDPFDVTNRRVSIIIKNEGKSDHGATPGRPDR